MRKRFILLFSALLCFASAPLKADLVFFIEQIGGPTPIVVGNSAEFGLFLGSTTSGAANTAEEQPLGVDVRATLDTGDGTAGLWSSGTNLQGGAGFDNDSFPTNSAFYVAFWGSPALTFPESDTRHQIASLILNTTGATAGNYTISLSELAALSAAFTEIPSINGGPGTYTLVPIPEPTTVSILALSMMGIMIQRRRR